MKDCFLCVSMRVFPEDYLGKIHLQCGGAPSNLLGAQKEQKQRRDELLSDWGCNRLLSLDIRTPGSLPFGP
jgi:hypothetical protein